MMDADNMRSIVLYYACSVFELFASCHMSATFLSVRLIILICFTSLTMHIAILETVSDHHV